MNEQPAQQPPPQPNPAPQQPTGGQSGDGKVLAAISYIPIIGLIMYFVKKDDPFVLFHAKQGSVLTIIWIALWILNGILAAILIPTFLWGVWVAISTIWTILYIIFGIFALIGFIKALMGQEWRMPMIGGWADKFGQKMDQNQPQQ